MTLNNKNSIYHHNFLLTLPIFQGLNEKELKPLFNAMQVKQFYKGEILPFDLEEHSKLYINFDGLFKLSKINEHGNELVLQIVDKKSIITPIYFSQHYNVVADFVKDTKLLYFSKESITKLTTTNHQFSLNIIHLLANSIQTLMLNTEMLQLKTTKEKVGWYLTYTKINSTFKLPYSKTLISSYLGIKPESFSRALNELKKEGITIKDKKITLNNNNALCHYCDPVIGSNCTSFKTSQCFHD
jgi:CRP-like cAMP-binding protein